MNLFITILAFLLAIGILVTIHELGHYWVARWCNVKILRFSIGFGKPLWLRRRGPDQTEWVIAALPLGGYVKMADERDESVEYSQRHRAFNNRPVWQRIAIVSAGPVANFLLAGLLYWALYIAGIPGVKPYIAAPADRTAAQTAGLREMDLIVQIDGREIKTWGDARMVLLDHAVRRVAADIEVEDYKQDRRTIRLDLAVGGDGELDQDFLGKAGLNMYRPRVLPVLSEVLPDGPAGQAGLKVGDRVLSVDGQAVERWESLVRQVSSRAGQNIVLVVERDGNRLEVPLVPESVSESGKSIGRIGVKPKIDQAEWDRLGTIIRYNPLTAITMSAQKVTDMSLFSLKMMGRMLVGDVSWKNLSGPITIADYAGQSAKLGWLPYVNFLALISISLGVLNLLPVPVLDGGQLMYYMVEILKGSPVSERVMQIGQQVGLALLLGLTAFAFYNDIHRLLAG